MSESITRSRQIRSRSNRILDAALELFSQNGIDSISVEDVARQAGVGPATIYRYFETKAELAISSAVFYWEKTAWRYIKRLETAAYQAATGKTQLTQLMELFVEIFEKEFHFLKFLYEFDIFVMKYQISKERLAEYEAGILNLKPYVAKALEKGLADGTLSFSYSTEEIYFSLMHTLLSLMQKLAANGRMLASDERVALSLQVRIAGELLLRGLVSGS